MEWREVCPKKWSLKRGWSFSFNWGPSHRTVKQQQRGFSKTLKSSLQTFFPVAFWTWFNSAWAERKTSREGGRRGVSYPRPCQHKGEGAPRLPETSKQPLKLGLPSPPTCPSEWVWRGPRARCCACPPENRFVPYSFPATAACTAFQFHQSTAATIDWRLPYPL